MKSHQELEEQLVSAKNYQETWEAVKNILERQTFIKNFEKEHPELKGQFTAPSLDSAIYAYKGNKSYHGPAICTVVKQNRVEELKLLITSKANVNIKDQYNVTALRSAIREDHADCLKLLTEAKASINIHDLFASLHNKNADCLKVLIDAKANINKKFDGVTPLIAAARIGNLECVKTLLAEKADFNIKSGMFGFGKTALQKAIKYDHFECVNVLIDAQSTNTSKKGLGPTFFSQEQYQPVSDSKAPEQNVKSILGQTSGVG